MSIKACPLPEEQILQPTSSPAGLHKKWQATRSSAR